jgi:hypothetical protein
MNRTPERPQLVFSPRDLEAIRRHRIIDHLITVGLIGVAALVVVATAALAAALGLI